jgi:hypothetical protein
LTTATIPAAVSVSCHAPGAPWNGAACVLPEDDEIRLELRRDPQVIAAHECDPIRVCDVLDRGLHQAQEGHRPHERQHGQQDQRERIERHAEPGHLPDEGQRDQVARQGGEIDAGATVRFGHGQRAGGLQVEVLRGRKRGRRF